MIIGKAEEDPIAAHKRQQAIKEVAADNVLKIWKQGFEIFRFLFWNVSMEGGTQPRRFLHLRDFPPQLPSVGGQKRNSQDEQGQKTVTDQNIGLGWVFWLLCSNLREEKTLVEKNINLLLKSYLFFFFKVSLLFSPKKSIKKIRGKCFVYRMH